MKRKFIILSILVVSILALAACKKVDSGDIKVIEKPKPMDSISQNQENQAKENNNGNSNTEKNTDLNEKGEVLKEDSKEYVKKTINNRATEVLTWIKDYDMEKLAKAVHPQKGVRFTPYGYVDVKENLIFSADEVVKLGKNATEYLWGSYDGSGEPIKLTFSEYYKKFVYDVDFTKAPEIGYNTRLGQGNSLDNSFEVYKNSIIVEYHFSEIDPQYEGLDWRSLRLVFEKMDNTWYIVGIIHDQWTI